MAREITPRQAQDIHATELALIAAFRVFEERITPEMENSMTFPMSPDCLAAITNWVHAHAFNPIRIMDEGEIKYRIAVVCMLFGARIARKETAEIFIMGARQAAFGDFVKAAS